MIISQPYVYGCGGFMSHFDESELTSWLADELAEKYTKLSFQSDPHYLALFDNLLVQVGRDLRNEALDTPNFSDKNGNPCYDDYACRMFMGVSKSAPQYKEFSDCLRIFDSQLKYDYWRKVGIERKLTKAQAEIFICCSAYAHGRSLKQHLAEFFRQEGIYSNLNSIRPYRDVVDKLNREVFGYDLTDQNNPKLVQKHPKNNNSNYFANAILAVNGREQEVAILKRFLACDMNIAWFQLAGVAGQGKSRLAFELISYARDELKWSAGFLEEREIRLFENQWSSWQPDKPHLLVFDYILGRESEIKPILQDLSRQNGNLKHNVRVLLIERQPWLKNKNDRVEPSPSNGKLPIPSLENNIAEWYLDLCHDNNYDGEDFNLTNSRFKNGVVELNALESNELVRIVKDISFRILDHELALPDDVIADTLNRIDSSGRPLYAYFLGQELAHSPQGFESWTNLDLLTRVLLRDSKTRWSKVFGEKPPAFGDVNQALSLAILSSITRKLNFNAPEIIDYFGNVSSQVRKETLTIIQGEAFSNSPRPQEMSSLEPDLLGEWLVLHSMKEGFDIQDIIEIAWIHSPKNTATFFKRISQDFPTFPATRELLSIPFHNDGCHVALAHVIGEILFNLKSNNVIPTENLMRTLIFSAERGNVKSILNLGICIYNGYGFDKSYEFAFSCFQQAADLGSVEGRYLLGVCYSNGEGVERNYEKALEEYEEAADKDYAYALNNIGTIYENGLGVNKNPNKAFEYYTRAAAQDCAPANINVASCYYNATGVGRDYKKAFSYYQKAARAGQAEAIFCLGICYRNGNGINIDLEKSFSYFLEAAEKGIVDSMLDVGVCYYKAYGCPRNFDKAAYWLEKAAGEGNVEAQFNIGACYFNAHGVKQNTQIAIEYFEQASAAGHKKAQAALASMKDTETETLEEERCPSSDDKWAKKQTNNILSDHMWPPANFNKSYWMSASYEEALKILSGFHRFVTLAKQDDILDGLECRGVRTTLMSFYPGSLLADLAFFSKSRNATCYCTAIYINHMAMPLNGNAQFILSVNQMGLSLPSIKTSKEYLDFFFSHILLDGRSFRIVSNESNLISEDALDCAQWEQLKNSVFPIRHVEGAFTENNRQCFQACVLQGNELFVSDIILHSNGAVGLENVCKLADGVSVSECKFQYQDILRFLIE